MISNRAVLAFVMIAGLAMTGETRSDVSRLSMGRPEGSFFALLVADADQSAQWYEDNLGFTFVRKTAAPGGAARTVMLEQDGVMIEIIEHRDSFGLSQVTDKSASMLRGIRKIGFTVGSQNFDRIFHRLQERHAQFRGEIFEDEGLAVRSFIVLDNNGNLVQFFARLKS